MYEKEREEIAKAQEEKKKKRNKLLHSSIGKLLKTNDGLRIFWYILQLTGIFDMQSKDGQREVGLRLLNKLHEVDPDALLKILKTKGDNKND